jgi:hypothetical protein
MVSSGVHVVQEPQNSWCRCWRWQRPITAPVAASRAANSAGLFLAPLLPPRRSQRFA